MGKNESIKWLPVLMIGLIILINSGCTLEDLAPPEPAEPEGGREEDLPDGPTLDQLGWTKEEIIDQFGLPDDIGPHGGPGGEELYYESMAVTFILAGEEGIVNNLYLHPGAEMLGIRLGEMHFDEIEEILGEPLFRGLSEADYTYLLLYDVSDKTGGLNEVELFISAEDEREIATGMAVIWKGYWN